MAQLDATWSGRQTRAQYLAIVWLRWRILVNGFRRKGGGGELAARIITIPLAAALLIGPTIGAGLGAWYFASQGTLRRESFLLWGIFIFSQIVSINLGQPGTTFDPTELIRFPMRLRSYVAIRLFFGMLAPANIVATVMSFAAAVGISIAIPRIWPYALLSLLVFAATNVFFTRMLFAWVDRWMSTRRAREVFTALLFTFSLGFQYLNFTFNPAYHHHRANPVSAARLEMVKHVYQYAAPVIAALPPSLTDEALVQAARGNPAESLIRVAECGLFALGFLSIFTLRTRTEFRGENLSDTANAVSSPVALVATPHVAMDGSRNSLIENTPPGIPQTVTAVLGKEFLYLRRNIGMFYGLIAPLVMVMLFASRLAVRHSSWIFPAALAYTLMGLAPFAYNSFGLEGAGTQFFVLAPVRLRDVFLGKNLMNFIMALVEGLAVFAIICYIGAPPTLSVAVAGLLWAAGTILFSTTLGNFRAVASPKKINLSRAANKQVAPLSALLSLGLLLAAAGFGAVVLLASSFFELRWLLLPVLLLYAAGGFATYMAGLHRIDKYALEHRDTLFEELCKQS